MEKRYILSLLVTNRSGVLTRLTGLFSRRGYNIDNLSVGETTDPALSRITIALRGDDYVLRQIVLQMRKLHDIKQVLTLDNENSVLRELMLIKVKTDHKVRSSIIEIVNVFRAKIVDISNGSLTVEITGDTQKTNAFLELLKPYGVLEIARTGLTATQRGEETIY